MALSKTTQKRIPLFGVFKERIRTSKTGKVSSRITLEFKTDEIVFDLDDFVLGQGPADAIRDIIQDQFNAVSKSVKPSTQERRVRAYNDRASPSYKRRYAGGRTGETPPDPTSTKWGTDSGRLAGGIHVRDNPTDASYTINVPANRLRRDTFGPGFEEFLRELGRQVKVIGDPKSVAGLPHFERALNQAVGLIIAQGKNEADALRKLKQRRLAQVQRRALQAAVGLGRTVAGG